MSSVQPDKTCEKQTRQPCKVNRGLSNFIGKIQASFIFDTTYQIKALIKGYPSMQYLHCLSMVVIA